VEASVIRFAFAVPILLALSTGVAAGQVTPPVVAAPPDGASSLTGACTRGATIHTTITAGTVTMSLGDLTCVNNAFAIDLTMVPISGVMDFSIDQQIAAVKSPAVKVRLTRSLVKLTPPAVDPVYAGASSVTGSCLKSAVIKSVAIVVRPKTATEPEKTTTTSLPETMCSPDGRFTIDVRDVPLRAAFKVQLSQTTDGVQSGMAEVTVDPRPAYDAREDFEASAFLGIGIDNFAAQDIQLYLNPEANGQIHERSVFGFDFEYRLWRRGKRQYWVYGETVHGVRSEDIDCQKAPNVPSCKNTIAEFAVDLEATPLFMLRNASSLEAYLGFRAELFPLNVAGDHTAMVYVNLQPGFLTVAGSDGDAKDMHHLGVGARAIKGPFNGSYLELGIGRTDLFATNRRKRIIIDGLLQREFGCTGVLVFGQIWADVDGASSADSIQSYFGLAFDVRELVSSLDRNFSTAKQCLPAAKKP
jgi:hypothetical protein